MRRRSSSRLSDSGLLIGLGYTTHTSVDRFTFFYGGGWGGWGYAGWRSGVPSTLSKNRGGKRTERKEWQILLAILASLGEGAIGVCRRGPTSLLQRPVSRSEGGVVVHWSSMQAYRREGGYDRGGSMDDVIPPHLFSELGEGIQSLFLAHVVRRWHHELATRYPVVHLRQPGRSRAERSVRGVAWRAWYRKQVVI